MKNNCKIRENINKDTNCSLICKNLSASYGKKLILNNVSIEINSGEFVCLCGLNGCGKSTLLSVLAGLQNDFLKISKKDNSPFLVLQENETVLPISLLSRKEGAKYISYMQQSEYSIWDFSVEDFILQGRFSYSNHGVYSKNDKYVVDKVIEELSLNMLRGRNVHSLSGGEMQKVKIARALAQEPLFILLDEPSANLDAVYEPRLLCLLKDLAKKKNIGILISIHHINIISELADKVCLLPVGGPVIAGSYKDVMTLENLKTTFGVDFQWNEKKYFQLLQ